MKVQRHPRISVVIPHFDQKAPLLKCLESLSRQTLDPSEYEVIVADNGTPGGVEEAAQRFDRFTFLDAPERGAAHARNHALAHARGDVIAFIDADCVAEPDWLEMGARALEEADLAGGRIIVFSEKESALSPVEAFERVFAFRQRDYVENKRFSATANLFARRAAADAIGSFTNGLSEDVDWCRRGVALGFHLAFNPKSIVRHPARRNWNELVRKWERLILERWEGFDRKGVLGAARWLFLAGATALSAGPHLFRILTSAELRTVRERLGAAGVLARIRLWRAWRMAALLAAR
jgi:glycosyltransferase involved in cell wall biosynthesis